MDYAHNVKQLHREALQRGVKFATLSKKAGFNPSILSVAWHKLKSAPGHRQLSDEGLRKLWVALEKLAPTPIKEMWTLTSSPNPERAVAALQELAPTQVVVAKLDGSTALRNLIGDRLQEMSTVQLAMLYAHIVGEEG